MTKAVIFDWDGLLVNTEGLWGANDKRWLANCGIDYKDELRPVLTGRSQKDCARIFKEHFRLPLSEQEIITLRLAGMREIYSNLKEHVLMPNAMESIKEAASAGFSLAIASGSPQDILDAAVKSQGVSHYFKFIISTDKVEKGKPSPDVYLFVAGLLKVKPEECIVLEDAENGVKAAKAANMMCFAVPNFYTKNQDFSQADKVLTSLKEFNTHNLI